MKKIIFGFDLSLNSTGVCALFFNDVKPEYMSFYNLIFDDESHVNDWIPLQVPNVTRDTYTLPKKIVAKDLVIKIPHEDDFQSTYSYNNVQATLKAMTSVSRLVKFLIKAIDEYSPDEVLVNIEGYINPMMMSKRQASTVQELSIMQGLFRAELIKLALSSITMIKIEITPPNVLKRFFTGKGNADKRDMIHVFMKEWGCERFIPSDTVQKIDDVVDAFALAVNMYYKGYFQKRVEPEIEKIEVI